jgi:hypothetical protein
MSNVRQFKFDSPADMELVAEFLYGKPRVRLESAYTIKDSNLTLDISGPAGDTAAQIFAGFCTVRFGEEGYSIERSVMLTYI